LQSTGLKNATCYKQQASHLTPLFELPTSPDSTDLDAFRWFETDFLKIQQVNFTFMASPNRPNEIQAILHGGRKLPEMKLSD